MGVLPVVLREIRVLNKSFSEKIDLNTAQLQTSINGVKATLDNVLTRVTEAENHISDTEDAVSRIQQLMTSSKEKLTSSKISSNVRVVGLKEGIKGIDPVKFFTDWMPEVLGADGSDAAVLRLEVEVEIERAHMTVMRCSDQVSLPVSAPDLF